MVELGAEAARGFLSSASSSEEHRPHPMADLGLVEGGPLLMFGVGVGVCGEWKLRRESRAHEVNDGCDQIDVE